MAGTGSVLFVDDDPNWVDLLRIAFKRAGILNPVRGVKSGTEAIGYLRGEGGFADRAAHPLPVLVLLDLRLDGMPGFDVLRWIRRQPRLAGLAVVVITGMAVPGDEQRAGELGANAFLVKPFSFPKLVELAQDLQARWLRPPSVPRRAGS